MSKEIAILHISDLHAKVGDKDKIHSRAAALLEDVARQNLALDLVLFTGDVAFSGKTEEYVLADELLFKPLQRRFQISPKKIFVIPGNHDVDRALINSMEETGLKKNLKNSEEAAKAFKSGSYASSRLKGYLDFFQGWPNGTAKPFGSHVYVIRGFEIGIACLNSAWRCSGEKDKDKGKLFLTHEQVNVTAHALDKCVLRIALIHHPFDWYHLSEATILEDLKQTFEVVLSGHLHEQLSIAEQTTIHSSLFLTVPALFDGFGQWEGYNLYRINIEDRAFYVDFRKFIRKRSEFDADTAHARGGRHKFNLPVRDISILSRAVTVQRIDACKTKLQEAIKQQLQIIQKVPNPVLVTPKIAKVSWSDGVRIRSPLSGALSDIAIRNSIIFGPSDSGKTILLESLAADLNEARVSRHDGRIALYADCLAKSFENKKAFEVFLDTAAEQDYPGERPRNAVILLDNVGERSAALFDYVLEISAEREAIFLIAVGSDLLFDTLPQKPGYEKCDFYQLSYWGPSRIREFVTKYFEGTAIDVDAAYNFVSASLEDTDLPATPWVVALYLSIFPTLGKQVSSLSFVRLLEKIEEDRLGRIETSSADSLYNKREILMRLACVCMDRASINVDRSSVEEMIEMFFRQKYLAVDIQEFLSSLRESGLISVSNDSVRFTYFAFYDYFLARAFERNLLKLDEVLTNLKGCLSVGQALCLYGGIFRENANMARTILQFVGTAFKERGNLTLKDLDNYISDLLLEQDQKKTVDEIADRDLKKRISYEAYDEGFEQRKTAQAKHRSTQFRLQDPTSKVEQLNTELIALKTFYNLFRNLENIDGEEKVKLLDQVLDLHIQCTIDLIRFFHSLKASDSTADFRSFATYIATMGGQVFLATNIANQSLQDTIVAARKAYTNDLKQLLLVCLYSDLRLPGYQRELEDYVKATNSLLAAELVYLQTRLLLVTHEALVVPASLIAAFQAAFRRRHELLGKVTKGCFDRTTPFDRAYSAEVEAAKKIHLQFFNAREELIRTSLYD